MKQMTLPDEKHPARAELKTPLNLNLFDAITTTSKRLCNEGFGRSRGTDVGVNACYVSTPPPSHTHTEVQ